MIGFVFSLQLVHPCITDIVFKMRDFTGMSLDGSLKFLDVLFQRADLLNSRFLTFNTDLKQVYNAILTLSSDLKVLASSPPLFEVLY